MEKMKLWHAGMGNGEGAVFSDEGRMGYENGTYLSPICEVIGHGETPEEEAKDREQLVRLIAMCPELVNTLIDCITPLEKTWGPERVKEINNTVARILAKVQGTNDPHLYSRWIRVIFRDSIYNFETQINGTRADVVRNYIEPINVGSVDDDMQQVIAVEFIEEDSIIRYAMPAWPKAGRQYLLFSGTDGAIVFLPDNATSDQYAEVQLSFERYLGKKNTEWCSMRNLSQQVHGVWYHDELAGPDGASFEVFQFPGVSDAHIKRAVKTIPEKWDAVRIRVIKIKTMWHIQPRVDEIMSVKAE